MDDRKAPNFNMCAFLYLFALIFLKPFFWRIFLFQELDIINIGINLNHNKVYDTLVNQETESHQRLE